MSVLGHSEQITQIPLWSCCVSAWWASGFFTSNHRCRQNIWAWVCETHLCLSLSAALLSGQRHSISLQGVSLTMTQLIYAPRWTSACHSTVTSARLVFNDRHSSSSATPRLLLPQEWNFHCFPGTRSSISPFCCFANRLLLAPAAFLCTPCCESVMTTIGFAALTMLWRLRFPTCGPRTCTDRGACDLSF